MEVADRIAVLSHGRIEQVGAPRELYERAGERRSSWASSARSAELGGQLVRPHDLRLSATRATAPSRRGRAASLHLGFEVRVELVLADGEAVARPAHARRGRGARAARRATSCGSRRATAAARAAAGARWRATELPLSA